MATNAIKWAHPADESRTHLTSVCTTDVASTPISSRAHASVGLTPSTHSVVSNLLVESERSTRGEQAPSVASGPSTEGKMLVAVGVVLATMLVLTMVSRP